MAAFRGTVHYAWRYLWLLVTVPLLIAAIVVGGWQVGWWFHTQNVNRQAHVLHDSYGYQSATAADLQQKIADILIETTQMSADSPTGISYADLHAQRLGEAQLACADASQLTAIPAAETGWVSSNCLAGAVSPSSPLER